VESVRVAEGTLSGPLGEAGLDQGALELAARQALSGAGFRLGSGARPYSAQLEVTDVRLAPRISERGATRVEVTVEFELSPVPGGAGTPSHESGVASVSLEGQTPREAWLAAFAGAARRASEALAIGFTEEGKSVARLVEDLASKDPRVRDHAVRVLAERRAREAVPALLERLRDEDGAVVLRVVGALAQIGDPRAVPPLIELASGPDGALAARLVRLIGDIGGEEAEGYLLTVEAAHRDPRVRKAAREALADMRARAEEAGRVAAGR
jgi:hypothetical protein